jgi:hypothetical protein
MFCIATTSFEYESLGSHETITSPVNDIVKFVSTDAPPLVGVPLPFGSVDVPVHAATASATAAATATTRTAANLRISAPPSAQP